MTPPLTPWVLPLDDPAADVAAVGGKGASLARLAAAGFDVPDGFHVTTAAYREFVDHNDLRSAILAAAADEPDPASTRIAALFASAEMPDEVAAAIGSACAHLGDGPVAVRSSATAEDLPHASFAGQQDSVLDVVGVPAVLRAVTACWASLWTARALAYRRRQGIAPADVTMAVVVQRMVDATAAGVLFTADPVTGAADRFVVNAVAGSGEALVSGAANPQVVVLAAADGAVLERHGEPVVDDATAVALGGLGRRIAQEYGSPMDVEWAVHDGRLRVLQARPVTVVVAEDWNDSLTGDYLWTCANLGEAIPSVMTPATWSFVQIFMSETMSVYRLGPHCVCGRIGGRFYLNLSLAVAAGSALGAGGFVRRALEEPFGRIPPEVSIPALPMSRLAVLRELLPTVSRFLRRVRSYQRAFDDRLADFPARCDAARERIAGTTDPAALADLWTGELDPLARDAGRLLAAGARLDGTGLVRVRPWLRSLVGDSDANDLLSGLHTDERSLASLGPVIGLDRLVRGEIDRADYAAQWGHRCPDEFEVSVPRPAEDPAWIARQLAEFRESGSDVRQLLDRRRQARQAALDRFRRQHPRRVRHLERRVSGAARGARAREAARSEVVRTFAVLRAYALRAGRLTGIEDDVFHLGADEIRILLGGDPSPLERVPARRKAYDRYRSLPPYPTLIRGRFDPERWAADPHRRVDVYDATAPLAPVAAEIRGYPGAAGVVEGLARVLTSMQDGDRLHAGEILVTTVTNVGWTPLFPRAAAVVTDIGAPLSHAAIVARELGIPAVVGTGNATLRLHTGDRVRVDGARGTVELLERA